MTGSGRRAANASSVRFDIVASTEAVARSTSSQERTTPGERQTPLDLACVPTRSFTGSRGSAAAPRPGRTAAGAHRQRFQSGGKVSPCAPPHIPRTGARRSKARSAAQSYLRTPRREARGLLIRNDMSTNTLLIIVLIVLLLGGGGFFFSRR